MTSSTGESIRKTTGDQANIVISTDYNRYRMSVMSAYIDPPAGAPNACKSLQTVTFTGMAGDKHIVRRKADPTYQEISRHVHVRWLAERARLRGGLFERTPNVRIASVNLVRNEFAS